MNYICRKGHALLSGVFVMELDMKKIVGHYWKVFIKDWIQSKRNKEKL